MRSEEEMYWLIQDCALKDPRVRLVLLSGSRANPDAPRDDLQDFDIVYFEGHIGCRHIFRKHMRVSIPYM